MSALSFSYGSAAHDGAAVEEKTASDGGESEEDEGEDPDSAAADSSSEEDISANELSDDTSQEESSNENPALNDAMSVESPSMTTDDDSGEKQSFAENSEHSDTLSESGDESFTDTADSDSDESYVPQNCRRNPHRAARDPSLAGAFHDAHEGQEVAMAQERQAPPPAGAVPTEREARLRAQRDLEHAKRIQAEAEVLRLTSLYDQARGGLDEANVEMAKVISEHHEALETAAGESPGGALVRPRGGTDLQRVLNKPAMYEGSNETCHIVDWLVAMFHFLMTLRVPVPMFVTTASTYLRGEALRFWANRQQTLTPEEARDWTMFKEALLERFDSENTAVTARIKLDHIKQGDMSMAKFVQKFDFITSYITDMSDADLIHRFLMAVKPDCKPALQNDPSTGVRWTEYVKLRKYALNMYPYASMPQGGRDPKKGTIRDRLTFPSAAAAAAAAVGADGAADLRTLIKSLKKRKISPNGEGAAGRADGPRSQQGTRVYENTHGRKVTRNSAQVKAIFSQNVCGFCYTKGHRAPECTVANAAKGFPKSA